MRISSLRPHHHALIVSFGAMLGIVGVAIIETTPASAAHDQTVPLQSIEAGAVHATESFASLVPRNQRIRLAAENVAPRSDGMKIDQLETGLRRVAVLDEAPNNEWTPVTTAALRLFQAKQHLPPTGAADVETVRRLVSVAGYGEIDSRCERAGIFICVSKSQKVARFVKNGKVLREIDVNIGPEPGDEKYGQYSSTRLGVNTIKEKLEDASSNLYGYPMPLWMQFDEGIGFHFSKYFSEAGYTDTSMGCVTIGNRADAEWLFANTPLGATVVVYY